MASSDSSSGLPRRIVRAAAWFHRFFLPFLLAVYVLAGLAPEPGAALRNLTVPLPGGHEEHLSLLLLAVLLFCAAAVIEWSEFHELVDRPSAVLLGLLCCWFGPAVLVAIVGPVLSRVADPEAIQGLVVGLALVAAMPVANSSAGWTQNARGNVALALALIVLSILLSPLSTPNLLNLMGLALSAEDTARLQQVVTQFSGSRFILWVILPSLAGVVAAWLAGGERIARAKPLFRIITLATILVLNYANASLAMRSIWSERIAVAAIAAGLAVSVCVLGVLLAVAQARLGRLSRSTQIALVFGLSMKHTGLALVLAGEVLHDQPRVILVILLSTIAQHLAAAAVDWRVSQTSLGPAPS